VVWCDDDRTSRGRDGQTSYREHCAGNRNAWAKRDRCFASHQIGMPLLSWRKQKLHSPKSKARRLPKSRNHKLRPRRVNSKRFPKLRKSPASPSCRRSRLRPLPPGNQSRNRNRTSPRDQSEKRPTPRRAPHQPAPHGPWLRWRHPRQRRRRQRFANGSPLPSSGHLMTQLLPWLAPGIEVVCSLRKAASRSNLWTSLRLRLGSDLRKKRLTERLIELSP